MKSFVNFRIDNELLNESGQNFIFRLLLEKYIRRNVEELKRLKEKLIVDPHSKYMDIRYIMGTQICFCGFAEKNELMLIIFKGEKI